MGEDEVGTHVAVKMRLQIIQETSARRHGEILQVRGDGAFLLFDSAVEAVSFALEAQKLMEKENATARPERMLRLRIGINLGEVLVDDGGVSGDSVNIAARIEPLAPPGSVCVTGAVYDQIRNKVAVGYEYLGPKTPEEHHRTGDVFLLREDAAPATMTAGFRRADGGERKTARPSVGRASLNSRATTRRELARGRHDATTSPRASRASTTFRDLEEPPPSSSASASIAPQEAARELRRALRDLRLGTKAGTQIASPCS